MDGSEIILSNEQIPNEVHAVKSLDEWIFERIRPYMAGRMLEVDDGDGHIAPFCRQRNMQTYVQPVDLTHATFETAYSRITEAFSVVVALHPVYEVTNHCKVITNCARLLHKEGYLVIQAHFNTALYEGLDVGYSEWKWNNMQFLNKLLSGNFNIIKTRCFIVTDEQLVISPQSVKYRERVMVFSPAMAPGFKQEGLCAILVGQKC